MMKKYFCFFLLSVFASQANSLKCMKPSDARLITSSLPMPDEWLNGGWHTGQYMSATPGDHRDSSHNRGVQFTSNGTRIWWLKNRNEDNYFLLTHDQSRLLCAQSQDGLRVNWFENTKANKEEQWCQWIIESRASEPSLFRLKSQIFIESISEIDFLYLDATGLFFDYQENSRNDVRNEVQPERKWFRWEKADSDQREFVDMEDECILGPSGYPAFLEDGTEGIAVRGATRSRSRQYLVSSNKLAECGGGWFLHEKNCYRIFRHIRTNNGRATRICSFFSATLVVPKIQQEQSFLARLVKAYDRDGEYWMGMKAKPTGTRFYDTEGQRLTYRKWGRGRGRFNSDKCSYWKNRKWYTADCASQFKVLCVRQAKIKNSGVCGRIQVPGVDTVMQVAARGASQQSVDERIVNGLPAEDGQFPWQISNPGHLRDVILYCPKCRVPAIWRPFYLMKGGCTTFRNVDYNFASLRFKIPVRQDGIDIIHNCGGTLIDDCWVLTAAHCVADSDPSAFNIRVGDMNNVIDESTEQEFDIERIIVHEEYTLTPSPRNDIALIKLASINGRCARYNQVVQAACLPDDTFPFEEGARCQVSGWGATNFSIGQKSASTNLMWVTLPKFKDKYCKSRYNRNFEVFVENIMFCAGLKTGGKDACTGDSGGPYVCRNSDGRYAISGVVSFGINCAKSRYPGVYTNVRHFVPWIGAKIRANGGGNLISTA